MDFGFSIHSKNVDDTRATPFHMSLSTTLIPLTPNRINDNSFRG
jgi:hypothetical protein